MPKHDVYIMIRRAIWRKQNAKYVYRNSPIPAEYDDLVKSIDNLCDMDPKLRLHGGLIYSYDRDALMSLGEHIERETGKNTVSFYEPEFDIEPDAVYLTSRMAEWKYQVKFKAYAPDAFVNWAKNNLDKIRVGPTFKYMLEKNMPYGLYNAYFYVRSDAALTMIQMIVGDTALYKRVVIKDK